MPCPNGVWGEKKGYDMAFWFELVCREDRPRPADATGASAGGGRAQRCFWGLRNVYVYLAKFG